MASRRRRRLRAQVQSYVEDGARLLVVRLHQILTTTSPVRTGFFRSNWVPSTGAADLGPADPPSGDDAAAALASSQEGANRRRAEAIGQGYTIPDGLIFIVNNTRYGPFLNGGSSAQAPAMFVEQGISQATRETARTLRPRRR